MPHACVSIVNRDIDAPGIAVFGGHCSDNYSAGVQATCRMMSYPLCKIAEKLGLIGIPADQELQNGIWISDGAGGKAYNYIELIDKLTDRIGG